MKHKLTLVAVILTALTLPTVAQNNQRTDPDHAKYSIIGTMKVDKETGNRYLIDAEGKNIDFLYVHKRLARPTDMADIVVRFDSVETKHPGGMTPLDFWRYDEEIGEWIFDREVRQGEQQMESTMKTNIMLVIDNSRSLGNDFKKVQDAAIEFVGQLYRESQGRDIFRVGVIGFSTVQFTSIRDILPLNASNYREIVSFIRGLEMQNGTALYYSLDKALDMLESDAKYNISKDEYKESRIYAFTDGLDQASVDDSRKLTTPTEYYDYLRPLMQGSQRKKIMNLPGKTVYSTIVTVRGGDMTDGQERQFDQRAKAICDDVRKLNDMSKLVSEFKKLAEDLVKSNQVLYCYIPIGANGRVGWTFAEDKVVVKQPKERKPSKFWMGVALEAGTAPYYDYYYGKEYDGFLPFGGLSLDFAWPLSPKFSLGASFSLNLTPGFGFGALAKFNHDNNSALLLGVGLKGVGTRVTDYSYDYYGDIVSWNEYTRMNPCFYIGLGWKFKSRWYVNSSVMYGGTLGFSLGVGYSIFGGK